LKNTYSVLAFGSRPPLSSALRPPSATGTRARQSPISYTPSRRRLRRSSQREPLCAAVQKTTAPALSLPPTNIQTPKGPGGGAKSSRRDFLRPTCPKMMSKTQGARRSEDADCRRKKLSINCREQYGGRGFFFLFWSRSFSPPPSKKAFHFRWAPNLRNREMNGLGSARGPNGIDRAGPRGNWTRKVGLPRTFWRKAQKGEEKSSPRPGGPLCDLPGQREKWPPTKTGSKRRSGARLWQFPPFLGARAFFFKLCQGPQYGRVKNLCARRMSRFPGTDPFCYRL